MNNETTQNKLPADSMTTSKKLSASDKIAEALANKIVQKQPLERQHLLAQLNPEQKLQLQFIEDQAICNFSGMLDELESALGMLRIGHHYGWRTLYILHSKKTIRKYEEILNIKIREIFDEEGPSAQRSVGLALAKKASNFWKAVSGEYRVENRREVK